MTVQGLVDSIVDHHIAIEDMVLDVMPSTQKRIGELLNNPGKRNKDIAAAFLESEIEDTISETGNEQYAIQYWGQIADLLELSFEDLNSIPTNERGDFFDTARNMMVAIAQQQAMLEAGIYSDSIKQGNEFAEEQADELRGVDVEELANNMDLKNQILDKRNGVK